MFGVGNTQAGGGLLALGRTPEAEGLLRDITTQKWHSMWSGVVSQAQAMLTRK